MLSIIIPVLNPDDRFVRVLEAVDRELSAIATEIIVVSAGMSSAARDACTKAGAQISDATPGRGGQLALGAQAATAPFLLFLHGDTILRPGCGSAAAVFMMDPANEGRAGWFSLAFDSEDKGAARVAKAANWRAAKFGLPYGDQGLLISRGLYDAVGGFGDLPLMEDVNLVRRLGKRRLTGLAGTVETSASRYESGGYWLRPARNLLCLFLYYCHVPNTLIRKIYGGGS
jgi:hypothetical protein